MTYLKAIVVGVATALLATVLLFVGMFACLRGFRWPSADREASESCRSDPSSVALVLIVGFAAGFFWTIRRRKRRGR